MPAISLCIVNHDGLAHLEATLPRVAAMRERFDEILLCDNASSDEGPAFFEQALPEGRVLRLAENRSPGAARSAGFTAARNDLVLFADNDIHLDANSLEQLIAAVEADPRCVIALPRVVLLRRPDRIQYEGAWCHWLGHMILREEDALRAPASPAPVEVDSMISACFLIVRSRWPEPHFFDAGYRFYYEDHDVGVRARLAGLKVLAVPAATILHGEGTPQLSLRPGGSYAPRRIRTMIEGRWRHLAKNVSTRSLLILGPALLAYEFLQFGTLLAKGWLPHWWSAVRATARDLPGLRAERRRIQRSRRIRDRELLRGGPLPFKPELLPQRPARAAMAACNGLFSLYWRVVRRLL